MDVTYVGYGRITKAQRHADGTVTFEASKATGPELDSDEQIVDPDWARDEMERWFRTGANLREMHQPIAAGKGLTLEHRADGQYVSGRVSDPGSANKVEDGTLGGLSIGIRGAQVIKDAGARNGRIVGGRIVEVSLVDRPANPTCKLLVAKADGAGGALFVEELIVKKDYDQATRERMAADGRAMPDGSFPIDDVEDLHDAISSIGRAKNPKRAKKHIKRRARALGATDALPDTWKKHARAEVVKLSEAGDIAAARTIQAQIRDLILSEVNGLIAGVPGEDCDIQLLLCICRELEEFICNEIRQEALMGTDATSTTSTNGTAGTAGPVSIDLSAYPELKKAAETAAAAAVKAATPEPPPSPAAPRAGDYLSKADFAAGLDALGAAIVAGFATIVGPIVESVAATKAATSQTQAALSQIPQPPAVARTRIAPVAGAGDGGDSTERGTLLQLAKSARASGDPTMAAAYEQAAAKIA